MKRSLFIVSLLTSLLWVLPAEARRKKAGETSSSEAQEAIDVQEEQLQEIQKLLDRENPQEAASLIAQFLENNTNTNLNTQAYQLQLRTYEKLKTPYTLFQFFPTLLHQPLPEDKTKDLLKQFINLSEEIGEETLLPTLLTPQQIALLTKEDQERVTYQQAKNALRSSNFADALKLSQSISPESDYYIKALNIEAVTLSQQGRFDQALLPFNKALAKLSENPKEEKLKTIVQLNLARNYYAAGIFSAAIEGFDIIPRTSPYWLEAQFEKAWALFRTQEINPMLSILQTHTSDFFVDGVYPEEEMLRIYGFFLLCKFETTSSAVDAFEERYSRHLDTLNEWNTKSEIELFEGYIKRSNGGLPLMLSRHFEFEDQMNEAVSSVEAINKELSFLEQLGSFTAPQTEQLQTRKNTIQQEQGARIKAKGIWKAEQIYGMLQNMKITRLDIGELKQRILNREAAIGKELSTKREAKRKIQAKRNFNVWTYQGEQWADELGYYQIKVPSDCPTGF